MDLKLPFGHKGEEVGFVPIEEVKRMRKSGKSDKEIITELKNKGYSFQSIERAMLEVLKSGVGSEKQSTVNKEIPPNYPSGMNSEFEPSPIKERFHNEVEKLPTEEELMPRPTIPANQNISFEMQSEPIDLIEEVVEGVVEEKFESVDAKFETMQKEYKNLKEGMENLKKIFASSIQKRDNMIKETKVEFDKLKEKFEDVVIKCDALERAFKQFLPDLTEKVREKTLSEKKIEVVE